MYKAPPKTTVNSNANTMSKQMTTLNFSIELGEYEYLDTHGFTVPSSHLQNERLHWN